MYLANSRTFNTKSPSSGNHTGNVERCRQQFRVKRTVNNNNYYYLFIYLPSGYSAKYIGTSKTNNYN